MGSTAHETSLITTGVGDGGKVVGVAVTCGAIVATGEACTSGVMVRAGTAVAEEVIAEAHDVSTVMASARKLAGRARHSERAEYMHTFGMVTLGTAKAAEVW
jgi:hypothetical protein